MVLDVGTVKMCIKPKADSTLLGMRKADLIEYIRALEHNYNVAVSFNENQARYIGSLGVWPGWTPVAKRKPEAEKYVLLWYAEGNKNPTLWAKNPAAVGRFTHGRFIVDGCEVKVSHWRPLPDPPEGGGSDG